MKKEDKKNITEITGKLKEKQKTYQRELDWSIIKKTILEAAHSTLGEPKKTKE